MKRIRRKVVTALDGMGLKEPVRSGINRVLAAGGRPPLGEPRVFRDLERLARGPRPRPSVRRGRVMFFTLRGWTVHVALETMLGEAAAQRGFEPMFFTCGGPLPLCGINNVRAADPTPCADCHGYVSGYLDRLGFRSTTLGAWVGTDERRMIEARIASLPDDAVESFEHEGLPLGRMVRTSVLWFLLRGSPMRSPVWASTFRGFLVAAALIKLALERALDHARPDRIVCLNGLFFAERVLRAVAGSRGVPVTTYERGFRPDTWVFRHDEVACEFPVAGDFEAHGDAPLGEAEAGELDAYLADRARGGVDAGRYWPEIEEREQSVLDALEFDRSRPIVTAFTNITWDSAIQERDIAFPGMMAWLEDTVRLFADRDDAQLVIRVHPAEVRLEGQETTESVRDALRSRLGELPSALRIVPPESGLSSYVLGRLSRFAMVYTSTVGLEMVTAGVPVVVAGKTHYRELGFTVDVRERDDYQPTLDRLIREDPPRPDVERARRYAHFFFFRFMIPLGVTREIDGKQVRIPLDSLADLAPGRDPALDVVMNGLTDGEPILLGPRAG